MQKISAFILAYNEAEKIKAAVETVLWADEIVVVDSNSTDGTPEIAESLGARVVQVPFNGFGDLRNRAIEACRYEWIFSLDSDERCTEAVRDEILALLAGSPPHDVYCVPRRNYMMGRRIRGSGWYPNFRQPQLFRKGAMRYTLEPVHEGYEAAAATSRSARCATPSGNFPSAIWKKSSARWTAIRRLGRRSSRTNASRWGARSGHAVWAFLKHYFAKAGFIDGWAGFVIAFAYFEVTFYRYAKRYEATQNWGPPPSGPVRRS